ncbi:aspartyl protease family protein [Lutimonas saemankumensis]|uniref:PDZ domain-containing protein n=1 Tax=Lutimonas saemankumensis TaxID=483016 RepID=UPI001CD1D92F|nr:PDZ domain-containing protein [Lutimonas saemankumensis]MCA0932266.1 aspartyl protease family protein [Lutimonas saemankumensis]
MFQKFSLTILLLTTCLFLQAQGRFLISDNSKELESVPFRLVNNMIVVTAEINGAKLSFLLDTGVKKTMLFNLKIEDSIQLKNVNQLKLKGLGEGSTINALSSRGNYFKMKSIVNPSLSVFVITDELFDLSAKMGMDIHGIIGGDLFRDFVIKINYGSKKLTFYKPGTYDLSKCKGCETFPLDFYNNKPFIDVIVQNHLGKEFSVKLLIDSGGGDSLWLFPHSNPNILIGDNYFEDFLGRGLSGDISGKRSLIRKLKIGTFEFENATVSYPDSTSIVRVHANKDRNGTLGAEILKRFQVIMDYSGSKITLRKVSRYFNAPFLYNKSGIELIYGGEILVKEHRQFKPIQPNQNQAQNITDIFYTYGLTYKPSYKISNIRHGSPAHLAGLLEGDIILEVNGKPAYSIKMEEIIYLFSSRDDKKIKLLVDRRGEHLRYEFYLKSLL